MLYRCLRTDVAPTLAPTLRGGIAPMFACRCCTVSFAALGSAGCASRDARLPCVMRRRAARFSLRGGEARGDEYRSKEGLHDKR